MDADTDSAPAAYTKSAAAAKQTISAGDAGYLIGNTALYSYDVYFNWQSDWAYGVASELFCLSGDCCCAVSAVGHIFLGIKA